MDRSLLHRLPDIAAFAHRRARELMALLVSSGTPAPSSPDVPDTVRVRLLHSDALTAMLSLLAGQGETMPLRSSVPLVWLAHSLPPAAESAASPLGAFQHHARALVELTVNLFVARELLPRHGVLATPAGPDPDHCVFRLLGTVFGHVMPLPGPPDEPPGPGVYLAGPRAPQWTARQAGPALLHDLALGLTRPRDPVLVAPAGPDCAAWATELDRRWVLVQPDARGFALLREQVITHRLARDGATGHLQETARSWTVAS